MTKWQPNSKRNQIIEDILDRLEALEVMRAELVGLPTEERKKRTVHPRMSPERHARDDGEGEERGMDGPRVGDRQSGQRRGWCFNERHNRPCPQPCLACAATCNPEDTINEVFANELLVIVRTQFT